MNRKLLLLNVVLVALAAMLTWQLRQRWVDAHAHEATTLHATPKAPAIQPPPAATAVEPPPATEYIDVAQQTLFSKDRNPNIVIVTEAPPPPPPEPPVPPMPAYHGQMAFAEPVIVLSTADAKQKTYRAGEKVGEFQIASFDRDRLTLEWRGKTFEKNVEELRPKETAQTPVKAATSTSGGPSSSAPNVAKMGDAGKASSNPVLGRPNGATRTCVPGDTSPAGTVLDGFRKVVVTTLMGPSCHWEPIK